MRILLWILILLPVFIKAQENDQLVPLTFETDLIPEGIAVDGKNQKVFLNSLKWDKIVTSNLDGSKPEDFIKSGQFGYLSGFGMTIKGDTLFALGNSLPKPKNQSILLLLNKDTGTLIQSYKLEQSGFAYLNDIAVGQKGQIYITDSESSSIYTINPSTNKLEVFFSDEEIKHPNGIAISKDDMRLYLASYTSGIRILDIDSKTLLNQPNDYKGIDGMKYFGNTLIGIVNSRRDPALRGLFQYELNGSGTQIEKAEKIGSFLKSSDIPTTFDIYENKMFYVTDSQMDLLDQENITILDSNKLEKYQLVIKSLLLQE